MHGKKQRYSTFVLQGCRSGVKPASLSLCFLSRAFQAVAGFLLTSGNDGLIFWLRFGMNRKLYGSALRGGYITGTPLIKAGAGLRFHILFSPSLAPPLFPRGAAVFGAHQKAHPSTTEKTQQHEWILVCLLRVTTTRAMIQPSLPLTAVLHKSQKSHCRLFTSQACDEVASLTPLLRPHTVLIPISPQPVFPSSQAGAGRRVAQCSAGSCFTSLLAFLTTAGEAFFS